MIRLSFNTNSLKHSSYHAIKSVSPTGWHINQGSMCSSGVTEKGANKRHFLDTLEVSFENRKNIMIVFVTKR